MSKWCGTVADMLPEAWAKEWVEEQADEKFENHFKKS